MRRGRRHRRQARKIEKLYQSFGGVKETEGDLCVCMRDVGSHGHTGDLKHNSYAPISVCVRVHVGCMYTANDGTKNDLNRACRNRNRGYQFVEAFARAQEMDIDRNDREKYAQNQNENETRDIYPPLLACACGDGSNAALDKQLK